MSYYGTERYLNGWRFIKSADGADYCRLGGMWVAQFRCSHCRRHSQVVVGREDMALLCPDCYALTKLDEPNAAGYWDFCQGKHDHDEHYRPAILTWPLDGERPECERCAEQARLDAKRAAVKAKLAADREAEQARLAAELEAVIAEREAVAEAERLLDTYVTATDPDESSAALEAYRRLPAEIAAQVSPVLDLSVPDRTDAWVDAAVAAWRADNRGLIAWLAKADALMSGIGVLVAVVGAVTGVVTLAVFQTSATWPVIPLIAWIAGCVFGFSYMPNWARRVQRRRKERAGCAGT